MRDDDIFTILPWG